MAARTQDVIQARDATAQEHNISVASTKQVNHSTASPSITLEDMIFEKYDDSERISQDTQTRMEKGRGRGYILPSPT